MKNLFFLALLLGVLNRATAQVYTIGHRQATFIDSDRQGRPVPAELYYPSFVAGDNVPIAAENGVVFPVLVFGHGFVMEWSAYANFWNTLVPQGYILAFPRTETGISPDHLVFAQDIAFMVKALQEESVNPASPFFNTVDTTSCVMGHSMGGGASFLSVQFNPEITAVVNFAAAETSPSTIASCQDIQLPVLMFAGANDCITPPETNQELMYDALPSPCKTLVTIAGASHCQFAEQNVLCAFGELTCTPAPDISRAVQHRFVDTLLIPWLDYHLKGSCQASTDFQSILTSSSDWTGLQVCMPCIPVITAELKKEPSFKVYPMPSSGNFYLQGPSGVQPKTVCIYSVYGVLVFQQELEGTRDDLWEINSDLPPGMYYVEVSLHGQEVILNLVVQ